MPWISSTVTAIAIVLALSLAGASSADAASERLVRANLAANPGSVRVGPNQIQLEPGVTMTLQGRGKKCNRGYFCIYENKNFGGASLGMSACKIYNLHSYRFTDLHGRKDRWDEEASSWINNQIGGVTAVLWDKNRKSFKAPIGEANFGSAWADRAIRADPC